MQKKIKKVKEERLEDILWACREHLRGKADMSDKRDVLLTLVFLKFMIEPFDGTLYDPCCGAGGMFIQCAKLVESKGGNTKSINVYGQESEPATYRLAKMNLAVRGISYHLGDKAISTFTKDQHPDLKVDYIMANPPFNLKKWCAEEELVKDPRWEGYGVQSRELVERQQKNGRALVAALKRLGS